MKNQEEKGRELHLSCSSCDVEHSCNGRKTGWSVDASSLHVIDLSSRAIVDGIN